MTSAPIRDPLAGHLLTPQNAAFLFIDHQPSQLATIRSVDPALLGVPVVHSTVNVQSSGQHPGRRSACVFEGVHHGAALLRCGPPLSGSSACNAVIAYCDVSSLNVPMSGLSWRWARAGWRRSRGGLRCRTPSSPAARRPDRRVLAWRGGRRRR